jgi:hypothetical protein
VKKRLALEWVLEMLVLVVLDDSDGELVDEIQGLLILGLMRGPP